MWVHHFAQLLKGWLNESGHPGIAQVRTCAEIGRHEQPVGVAVDLTDGWLFVLQCVGAAPTPGGDQRRSGESTTPEPFDGVWADRADYRHARAAFETKRRQAGGQGRNPQAKVTALLGLAEAAIAAAAHPEVASVEISTDRLVLRVGFVDGSKVYGYAAGFMAPGAADFTNEAHRIPDDWY